MAFFCDHVNLYDGLKSKDTNKWEATMQEECRVVKQPSIKKYK